MAAVSSKGRDLAGIVGKRIANQIWTRSARDPTPSPSFLASASRTRRVHYSSYDKNVDDQIRPTVVPDDVIHYSHSDNKYWGPHPKTGVFGPAEKNGAAASGSDLAQTGLVNGSVLEKTVWFRPLEDVDKPPYA